MLPIDVAAHGSRWRRRHPLEKALLGLGLTVTAVCLPPWPGGPLVAAATLAVLQRPAGVAGRHPGRGLRIPQGFWLTGAL
ncbi:cobalt ECF transporter T component CbiQ, partial [Streptomyces vinaceus]